MNLLTLIKEHVANTRVSVCPLCHDEIDPDSLHTVQQKHEFDTTGLCKDCQDYMFEGEQRYRYQEGARA